MEGFNEINSFLSSLIDHLKKDIRQHPHFLINEHDLQAYIYSKLIQVPNFNKYKKDGDDDENYLIHCEYPRGYYENNNFRKIGRWDIAILDSSKIQMKEMFWDEKPVLVGFELKVNIDETGKKVLIGIDNDQPAVESTEGVNQYAEWAVLFHINIGKKKRDGTFNTVKDCIRELQRDNKRTFYVYLEFYYKRLKPKELFSCPDVE